MIFKWVELKNKINKKWCRIMTENKIKKELIDIEVSLCSIEHALDDLDDKLSIMSIVYENMTNAHCSCFIINEMAKAEHFEELEPLRKPTDTENKLVLQLSRIKHRLVNEYNSTDELLLSAFDNCHHILTGEYIND